MLINRNIELVIHCAAKAHFVPKSVKDEDGFFDVNFQGTINLLNGLEKIKLKPKAFVYISSVAVYGQKSGINIKETESLKPIDAYGLSKQKAETLIINWCNNHGIKCSILRLPLLIGENPIGNLESMINGIQSGYFFNICGIAPKKSMVLAEDVANVILRAARVGGVYNLTDGYNPSIVELSNLISRQLGKKEPLYLPFWLIKILAMLGDLLGFNFFNSSKLDKITTDLTFNDSKARNAFGWNPTPVLKGFNIHE
jgi:nucleoside-diphosphate-sugar epimerase